MYAPTTDHCAARACRPAPRARGSSRAGRAHCCARVGGDQSARATHRYTPDYSE